MTLWVPTQIVQNLTLTELEVPFLIGGCKCHQTPKSLKQLCESSATLAYRAMHFDKIRNTSSQVNISLWLLASILHPKNALQVPHGEQQQTLRWPGNWHSFQRSIERFWWEIWILIPKQPNLCHYQLILRFLNLE